MSRSLLILLCVLALPKPCHAQDSIQTQLACIPRQYPALLRKKMDKNTRKFDRQTQKALSTAIDDQEKFRSKLAKSNPQQAAQLFNGSIDSLRRLQASLKSKLYQPSGPLQYNGYLDSVRCALGFLKTTGKLSNPETSRAIKSCDQLNSSMTQADLLHRYLQEQKQLIIQRMSSYSGYGKQLTALNKQAYYYGQQIRDYKEAFQDKRKAEAKGLQILRTMPAYQNFLQKNSQITSLFNLKIDSTGSTEGLQTRSQVEDLVKQKLGGGSAAQAGIGQQMEAARGQMEALKNKLPSADNAGEMPSFKPNEMKTKSLRQRIEFGATTDFKKSSLYYPTTGDLAGQVGYKFSKNGSAGIGASYKLGLGSGFGHIAFSSQGVGLRSFAEWKIKTSFYLNGGFEYNYNAGFKNLRELRNYDTWTRSALIGLAKKYQISKKLKGNIQLLYDFLWDQHVPLTQPLILRFGYNF